MCEECKWLKAAIKELKQRYCKAAADEALQLAKENRRLINELRLKEQFRQETAKEFEQDRKIRDIVDCELDAREQLRAEEIALREKFDHDYDRE